MMIYYNEIDKKAVAWLWQLMEAGVIARGIVDERSIEDVVPSDLEGFTQCHFFAGIGVWSYALRSAGWPDDRPVWTGSCPCQPFSTAGKRGGFTDERHLWPAWYHLISQCRPVTVFGEQVASKDGLAWLDTVHADMEGAGYTVGANDLCAAGFGAPHIRQRLYFVADAAGSGSGPGLRDRGPSAIGRPLAADGGGSDLVGDALGARLQGHAGHDGAEARRTGPGGRPAPTPGVLGGFWTDAEWLPCRDGKLRAVEPGTFPLAYGAAERVGRLRGYGNAIVAPVAIEFIKATMEVMQ